MQHFEDEVHADLLKTAEDVSKEAGPLKQRLLAPALMGLSMLLDAVSAVEVKKQDEVWVVRIIAPNTVKGETPGGLALNTIAHSAPMWFSDEKTANRVKAALEHLVELSQAGRPKEPF